MIQREQYRFTRTLSINQALQDLVKATTKGIVNETMKQKMM
jgi:hypothetical protein